MYAKEVPVFPLDAEINVVSSESVCLAFETT